MAKKDIKFTLDTIDSRYSPVGTVKQLDSVFLYIKITENGVTKDLTGQTIKLFAIKEDKKIVEQTTKINITNQREGLVEIELLNAALQVHGFTYFELEISDSNGIISTSDFILRVNKRVGSDEAIESTNEVATLKKIEEYVAQAKVELQKFKELQTEMLKTNETINIQENLRVSSEAERVNSESLRVKTEAGRVAAEIKREEEFNKFEGKINANTEELKKARSATTGEQFNSLDERIDAEVDRINNKIEISFLEQEDSESHVIENTVEGLTTDMVVKGKTLVNIVKSHRRICAKGASVRFQLIYPKLKVGTYTVIINASELTKEGITMYDMISSVQYPYGLKTGLNIRKIDVREEGSTYAVIVGNDNVDGTQFMLESLLILEGDWTNKPIPQYFEGIKSFGQEEDKISILSQSGNFFDGTLMDGGIGANGEEISSSTDNRSNYLKIIGGLKYNTSVLGTRINRHYAYYDINKKFIKRDINVGFSKAPLNASFLIIWGVKQNITQINVGELPSEYYSHQQNKKDILLSKYGFKDGLKGVNDTVFDKLNSTRNTAIKKVDKYTFTGNEDWRIMSESNSEYIYFEVNFNAKKSDKINIICNNFIARSFSELYAKNTNGISAWSDSTRGTIFVGIEKSKLTSLNVEGFKTWLKSNPTTIFYELAEPVEIPLTENINLKTFGERTYVHFENSISGTSSFKAPVNTLATIARLNRENSTLEEENKNLRQDFESTTLSLTDSDLELVKQNVDMDFRLMEVEFALDIPQAILSSNINLKNKKGEIKNMARTPYEMMKIVILSGDYDREDYMHKVEKYYERGRMTKEEHDELISLMTADEVISK